MSASNLFAICIVALVCQATSQTFGTSTFGQFLKMTRASDGAGIPIQNGAGIRDSFSLTFWARFDGALGQFPGIVWSAPFAIFPYKNYAPTVYMNFAGGGYDSPNVSISDNVWSFFVMSFDSPTKTIKFYVNGTFFGPATPVAKWLNFTTLDFLNVGKYGAGTSDSPFTLDMSYLGGIDELGIWKRLLTQPTSLHSSTAPLLWAPKRTSLCSTLSTPQLRSTASST